MAPCNPNPGTVVDKKVTILGKADFFVVSQELNNEVVSPTDYNIIKDSTGFSNEFYQILAYTLVCMHHNSPSSVPALLHYCVKLADFVNKTNIHLAHGRLDELLYFL